MQPLSSILIFSVTLVALTLISKPLYQEAIQKDLENKVNEVTANHITSSDQDNSDIEKLNLSIDDLHLTLNTSHLPSEKADALVEDLDGISGVYLNTKPKSPFKASPSSNQNIVTSPEIVEPDSTINDLTYLPKETNTPFFSISINTRIKVLYLTGEIASENEKQQLITTLCEASSDLTYLDVVSKDLIIKSDLTTIRHRDTLYALCREFLTHTKNASIEWSPKQTKLAGQMDSPERISSTLDKFENLSPEHDEIIATSLNLTKPPSIDLTLERLSNNTIILKGTLPSKAMGDKIYKIVANSHTASIGANNKSYIANNISYTDQDIDAWWLGVPEAFIGGFLKQTEGIAKIEYTNEGLYIEAIYKNQDDFNQARTTFLTVPKHLDVYDDFMRVKGEKDENNTPPFSPNKIQKNSSQDLYPNQSNNS